MYKFVLLIVCVIFISCNASNVPNNILPPEKMQQILWQQIKADVYTRENLVNDSLKKTNLSFENEKLQTQIFKNYGTTKEIFYESYNYYLTNEEQLSIIVDSMIAKQTRTYFDELASQNNRYMPKPKNIFMEEMLKKPSVFSMNPDTLNYNSTNKIPDIVPQTISTESLFNKRRFKPQMP